MSSGKGGMPGLPNPTQNLFDNGKQDEANRQNFAQPYVQPNQPQNYDISAKGVLDQINAAFPGNQYMSMLPQIQAQLSQQSQFQKPMYDAMTARGEQNVAKAQSDAGARGMRGSDVEAAGMSGARTAASNEVAQAQAQLAMQQSSQMAEYIMKLRGMDVAANQEYHTNLAQAIGQELAQRRQIEMAQKQLDMMKKSLRSSKFASMLKGGLGIVGGVVGGVLGSAVPGVGTVAGAGLGMTGGMAVGGFMTGQ